MRDSPGHSCQHAVQVRHETQREHGATVLQQLSTLTELQLGCALNDVMHKQSFKFSLAFAQILQY